jgi:hypothetical protein
MHWHAARIQPESRAHRLTVPIGIVRGDTHALGETIAIAGITGCTQQAQGYDDDKQAEKNFFHIYLYPFVSAFTVSDPGKEAM